MKESGRMHYMSSKRPDKMAWKKWYGQNGTYKMVATFIDSDSTELNFICISYVYMFASK